MVEQCCERDHDYDGNCDRHAAPGITWLEALTIHCCPRCGRYTRVLYCATLFSSGATTCVPNICPRCVCKLPVIWLEVRGATLALTTTAPERRTVQAVDSSR